jgi:uncharacterized heparinase superfamily protein
MDHARDVMGIGRIFRTVRHLQGRQIFDRVARSVRLASPVTGPARALRTSAGQWTPFATGTREWQDAQTVRILGREGRVAAAGDWQVAFPERLYLYHLHYLDQLRSSAPELMALNAQLLEKWAAENSPGSRPGWEPYPTSRRLVNCIVWAMQGGATPQAILTVLADQARWLRRNIETHLLANHVLANAKALIFAGSFYAGREAQDWMETGRELLTAEVAEQILRDGGHIERSPMYHGLVLLDLLDLLNLGRRYPEAANEALAEPIGRMLTWYAAMRHPDGAIPLFNDAALGVAPSYTALAAYADRLGIPARPAHSESPLLLRDSGYARVSVSPWTLFADGAELGPDYQPGHAHADTLTFELSHGAYRLFVDTGVSTYERGAIREEERSTTAHNTLTLDGMDSSEVWHAFRVGRRARVREFAGGIDAGKHWVSAAHDGYRHTVYRALHRRTWELDAARVQVTDELSGRGAPQVGLAFHLHPDCAAQMAGPGSVRLRVASGAELELQLDGQLDWRLDSYAYAPTFGARQPATVVRGARRLQLPCRLHTELTIARVG